VDLFNKQEPDMKFAQRGNNNQIKCILEKRGKLRKKGEKRERFVPLTVYVASNNDDNRKK